MRELRDVVGDFAEDPEDVEALLEAVERRRAWRLRRGGFDCASCGHTLPAAAFGPDDRTSSGLESRCRRCEAGRKRERRAEGWSE